MVNSTEMKRWLFLCLALVALFFSCTPKVNIYADYKQVPIIYGLLDATADTNYIKITRGFYATNDIDQYALNPDSSNYPGKLDARLIEYCNGDSIREIILDTITIHNKAEGAFYAPLQKLYYTAEPLHLNTQTKNFSYKLKVVLPDRVLTAETDMVGDANYGVQSLAVDFSKEYFDAPSRHFLFRPAINAVFFDVSMKFTFLEQRTPDGDSVTRTMQWRIGIFHDYYMASSMEHGCYVFQYRPEHFYETLEEFIGGDTSVVGLRRYLGDFPVEVVITAGGEALRQYVYSNDPSLGFNQGVNEITLIEGGYGVFSSRITAQNKVRLGGNTVPDLLGDPKWGFRFIGGKD